MVLIDNLEPVLTEVVIVNYDGDYDEETGTNFHGVGIAVLDNGNSYEGSFRTGLFHGTGTFTWTSGVKYEGEFENGIMHGVGKYVWHDGSTYEGSIKDGLRHGKGKFVSTSQPVQSFDGYWSHGKREGHGIMTYDESSVVYSGEWLRNMRHGYGVMQYGNGDYYEGLWEDDKKNGEGLMFWKSTNELYTGQWSMDLPHGKGEQIWGDDGTTGKNIPNRQHCNIYRGEFVNGQREGSGSFFYMNGSQYNGQWYKNEKNGEGVFITQSGKIFAGLFESNRPKIEPGLNFKSDFLKSATEDVSPQFFLHIRDVFDRYPQLANPDEDVSKQIASIERLLLKYNGAIRHCIKQYTSYSNQFRSIKVNEIEGDKYPNIDSKSKIERVIIRKRNIESRLFCLTLEGCLKFFAEAGLLHPPYLLSLDVSRCLRRMRTQRKNQILQTLSEYKNAYFEFTNPKPTTPTAPNLRKASVTRKKKKETSEVPIEQLDYTQAVETHQKEIEDRASKIEAEMQSINWHNVNLDLNQLVDDYYDPRSDDKDFDIQSYQPVLPREFVELFVRCIAEIAGKSSTMRMTLFHAVHQILATKILPMSGISPEETEDSELREDDFVKGLYSVQTTRLLWGKSYTSLKPSHSPGKKSTTVEAAEVPTDILQKKLLSTWKSMKDGGTVNNDIDESKLSVDSLQSGVIKVKDMLKYLISVRGTLIRPEATIEELFQSFNFADRDFLDSTLSSKAPEHDIDARFQFEQHLGTCLDYTDMVHMVLRVVVGKQWFVNESKNNNGDEETHVEEVKEENDENHADDAEKEIVSEKDDAIKAQVEAEEEIGTQKENEEKDVVENGKSNIADEGCSLSVRELMESRLNDWYELLSKESKKETLDV